MKKEKPKARQAVSKSNAVISKIFSGSVIVTFIGVVCLAILLLFMFLMK